ncbi:hypothetical protein HH310_06305 [Actinoplanes sp. TBRC 11911]|nr:hypothetical protein [Actinoplanes sp. TBRC 11911]
MFAAVVGIALLLQNGGSACAAPPSTSAIKGDAKAALSTSAIKGMAPPSTSASKGKATFYDLGGGTGNCSFPSAPADDLFVALGPVQYAAGAACGTYLDVTGPKGKVRVKVIDSCPPCEPGHIDLSRTAFKKIGAEVDGVIPITYKTVKNPVLSGALGGLSVRIKEGASRYWFAALIDNHGTQLTSVKVATGSGAFRTAHREDYNYWIIDSGAGPGPYKIKVSDVYGRTATLTGITMTPERTQKTTVRLGGTPKPAATKKPAKKAAPAATPRPPSSPPVTTEAAPAAQPLTTTLPADAAANLAARPASCQG